MEPERLLSPTPGRRNTLHKVMQNLAGTFTLEHADSFGTFSVLQILIYVLRFPFPCLLLHNTCMKYFKIIIVPLK